jgi:Sec-independent protein secretion pathway component TatC
MVYQTARRVKLPKCQTGNCIVRIDLKNEFELILASLGEACFAPTKTGFPVGALHATPSPVHQIEPRFLEPALSRLPANVTRALTQSHQSR